MQQQESHVQYEGLEAFEKALQSPSYKLHRRSIFGRSTRDLDLEEAARLLLRGWGGLVYATQS